jgi:hypothetical protein
MAAGKAFGMDLTEFLAFLSLSFAVMQKKNQLTSFFACLYKTDSRVMSSSFFPVISIYAHLIIAILLHVNFQHVKGTVQRDGSGWPKVGSFDRSSLKREVQRLLEKIRLSPIL